MKITSIRMFTYLFCKKLHQLLPKYICSKRKTCELNGLIHARIECTRKFLAHPMQYDVNNSILHRHNTSFSISSVRVKNRYVLIQNLFCFPSLATLSTPFILCGNILFRTIQRKEIWCLLYEFHSYL